MSGSVNMFWVVGAKAKENMQILVKKNHAKRLMH